MGLLAFRQRRLVFGIVMAAAGLAARRAATQPFFERLGKAREHCQDDMLQLRALLPVRSRFTILGPGSP